MYHLDHILSPDEFSKTFVAVNKADRERPPHPWDVLFNAGRCTREQLHGWAKERYYFLQQVPIKEYGILQNCPYPEVRRLWLPKAIEEEGEDIIGGAHGSHPDYWVAFCEGLGLTREEVTASEPLAGVKFAVDAFAHASAKHWLLGIAVSEGQDTARGMARTLEVLRKHYAWIPDEALEFYRLHADVDVGHGELRMEILSKYCTTKELQEECINGQLVKNDMRRVMADAIYMAYVVKQP